MDIKLWMGDIKPWMDEAFIMNSFIIFGFRPKGIILCKDKNNMPQNFCFIKFNSFKEANNALLKLNGEKIPKSSSYFKLNLSEHNSNYKKNNKIYIGNLPLSVNDSELYKYIQTKYPSVYKASVTMNKGVSKGYGYAYFSNEQDYYKCLKEMDGMLFYKNKLIVKRKASPKQKLMFNKFSLNSNDNYIKQFNDKNEKKHFNKFEIENINSTPIHNYDSILGKNKDIIKDKETVKKNHFLNNLNLIERDCNLLINLKIKESLNNIIKQHNDCKRKNNIPDILIYYGYNI